jgi:SAM-dependent methyltransferase
METLEEVNRQARERLHPSLTNPSWLVLRKRREIFQRWLSMFVDQDLDILDVGGRIQPYRSLFGDRLRSYVALDLRRTTPLVDVVARGEQIPLMSEHFDLVICTQVLEYVLDPSALIAEVHRVLKPGGWLMLSVPSVFPRDSDGECWRFFPAALHHLLAAFTQIEVVPEGGSVTGFFRTVNACLNIVFRYPRIRTVYRHTVCPVLNLSGVMLERISRSTNDQFAANYSVRACK